MKNIIEITRCAECLAELVSLWERSVTATHDFLTRSDIAAIKPEVEGALCGIANLYVWKNEENEMLGFIGVQEDKIEMLFVDPCARGKGIGKALAQFAINTLRACKVDVNEQNAQATGFYRAMGFVQFGRSALDGQGNPFPLLHLQLENSR